MHAHIRRSSVGPCRPAGFDRARRDFFSRRRAVAGASAGRGHKSRRLPVGSRVVVRSMAC
jgi:hypothetical protein